MPPRSRRDRSRVPDNAVWATFEDGSTVIAKREGGSLSVAGIALSKLPLLALWGEGVELQEPLEPLEIERGGAAMLLRADPVPLRDIEFREKSIFGFKEDGSKVIFQYGRLPTLWFRPPPPNRAAVLAASSAGVLTVSGEFYRLGADSMFEVFDIDERQIVIKPKQSELSSLTFPWSRIATLDLPGGVGDASSDD